MPMSEVPNLDTHSDNPYKDTFHQSRVGASELGN